MRRLVKGAVLAIFFGACPALAAAQPAQPTGSLAETAAHVTIRGEVTDTSGAAVQGATVTVVPVRGGRAASVATDAQGRYVTTVAAGTYVVRVTASGFSEQSRRVNATSSDNSLDITLQVEGVHETVDVGGSPGYSVPAVISATRTATVLRDVPQAVSVVSRTLIDDQRMTSMADVARYMPGVGFAQGEGNRDTPILRGNSTTSDFFVDGVRDDAQYFRDVYNVDRVEALKGANAMIFGRGGAGGVINRVSRQADWGSARELAVQLGSWNNKRLTADVGDALNDRAAFRATAVFEDAESYRDGVTLQRYGVNPTAAFRLGSSTTLRAGYEFFRDERVADRGVSSYGGRPLDVQPGTFFGDPDQSPSDAIVHMLSSVLEHRIDTQFTIRNRTSYGTYDKFYQNVFPGAVNAAGTAVAISAYNQATDRQNLFNQTDVVFTTRTGRVGHTLLAGAELGRQHTANFRETGYFTGIGPNVTSFETPLTQPTVSVPVTFRQSATDADNASVATVASLYAQDQMTLSSRVDAIVGLRFDSFHANVLNKRTAADFSSRDNLLSPRLGLVYKLRPAVSLYGSYSQTYLPRAGEQLASLSLSNQALDPEEFRNYEVGAKWDVRPALSLTAAVYRLDRGTWRYLIPPI